MTSVNLAVYLTCLFLGRIGLGTNLPVHVRQESGFLLANVGDNVTLQCFYASDVAAVFLWYKQTLGQKPVLISTFYKHDKVGTFSDDFTNSQRFFLETKDGKNHLTITDLRISDSATYYCVSCSSYKFEFGEGTIVSVKGSGFQASVRQSEDETIQSGDSISCTVNTGICDGQHSVHWFKNEEEPHPGLIYTVGGMNNQCERTSNTQTHTCEYNLPINSQNLSHSGTYYCAVASCGRILFGNGTKLELADEVNSSDFLVHFLSGALAFTTILNVLMVFLVHKMKGSNSCQCTDTKARSSSTANTEEYQDADNLHYAALRNQRFNASRRQREDSSSQCVYSSVKH
ncbi:immunoglobulin kappa light chain-like [Acanthochromis polyacanthus]|uniref:immunoglobulin kappa light chain-like n=1 Tax=Acanthochromis polyacanthus TaxID=80966 RepID=UPI002234BA04|nr:immunoglobulin kappa light chain-like [Acanthochromis polyacanthus]